MKILGIDIGTTTVSAVVWRDGAVIDSRTVESRAFIPTENAWEKIQDATRLLEIALGMADELMTRDVDCVGLTGQQHGIVYLDSMGNALGPLYIWQDSRGDQPFEDGLTYAGYISRETGYAVASGYGLVTHFYNVRCGLVPDGAVKFCTIHDYVAMKMAGLKEPVIDASDAASFGLFNVREGCFDVEAVKKLGLDPSVLPSLSVSGIVGCYKGKPVAVAIGDNQASFIGATGGAPDAVLVNIGTGSQVSVRCGSFRECEGLETRPFPLGGCLLVGASLCGGRAYALLDQFFCSVAEAVSGIRPEHCYDEMARLVEAERMEDAPLVSPLFQGSRRNPSARASISGLSIDNFTPGNFVKGFCNGMAEELYGMYRSFSASAPSAVYGAGNAIRLNKTLRESVEKSFGACLRLSPYKEEAACGAAIFASIVNHKKELGNLH